MKPFFTYYGGKYRAAPKYPTPQHDSIIEPFAGSAGYSVRHYEKNVTLVDLDEKVAATWRYLQRTTKSEILRLPLEVETTVDDLSVCQEAKYVIGWWLNKGAASPMKSPSRWMRDSIRCPPGGLFWGEKVRQRIADQIDLIRHWTIIEGSFWDVIDLKGTWFIDPPYQKAGKNYRKSSKQIDFESLAIFCQIVEGQVIVCENEGADWLPFKPFISLQGTHGKHGGKVSKEAIWTR